MNSPKDVKKLKEKLLEHCNEGFSIASFLGTADMTHEDLNTLCRMNKDLKDAVEIADYKRMFYWESQLKSSLSSEDSKTANISKSIINESSDIYEKFHGKNYFTSVSDNVKRRVEGLTAGDRSKDILEERRKIKSES